MNLFDVLLTSGRVWLFTLIGIVIAAGIWCFLPESSDRLAMSGWAITGGYLVGWLVSMLPDRKTE